NPAQMQRQHTVRNHDGNRTSTERTPHMTKAQPEGRIPKPDCCCVLETRRDSDLGTYTTHSLQNPAGHWIGSFETPRRISKCDDQLYVKVDPELDKRLKNRPRELLRHCLQDSYLQCSAFRTIG